MEYEKVIYLSLLSGDLYTVDSDETDNLDDFQVPLSEYPDKSCKKCYGRGYIGYNREQRVYQLCKCAAKRIDRSRVKEGKG